MAMFLAASDRKTTDEPLVSEKSDRAQLADEMASYVAAGFTGALKMKV